MALQRSAKRATTTLVIALAMVTGYGKAEQT